MSGKVLLFSLLCYITVRKCFLLNLKNEKGDPQA